MGEVHWKPKEDIKPVPCTCDCGEIYWTPVIEDGDHYIPQKHAHNAKPVIQWFLGMKRS